MAAFCDLYYIFSTNNWKKIDVHNDRVTTRQEVQRKINVILTCDKGNSRKIILEKWNIFVD